MSRREATCECCHRNDAPQGEKMCVWCANYQLGFDIGKLTLEEIDAEYGRTLDKLERLSKLREAVAAQDKRRIEKLVAEYQTAKAASKE